MVTLDGKPVRTPARQVLVLPTAALAQAVAEEWRGQGEALDPASMLLTQIANTALDRAGAQRFTLIDELAAYVDVDSLCYWAEGPPALVRRQEQVWRPILNTMERVLEARFIITSGVLPAPQPSSIHDALMARIRALAPFPLTVAHTTAGLARSVILGLALAEQRIDPDTAYAAAFLDELFQAEEWGDDADAAARREAMAQELETLHRCLALLTP